MKRLLCISLILLFFSSCAKNLGTSEADVYQVIEQLESGITFEQLRDQVLIPKCLRCHAWVAVEDEVKKRIVPGEPLESALFTLVDNGSMPVGGPPLVDLEKDIIRKYILGLQKNDDDTGSDDGDDDDDKIPPIQLVTFETIKNEILVPQCIRCHRGMDSEAGIAPYIDKEDPVNSKLLEVIESGFMPLRAPMLSENNIELLKEYLMGLEN